MFKIIAKDRHARCGQIDLSHGMIETPVVMPVGTQGTVKAISVDTLKKIGFKIILGNTYHLYLRPGIEILNKIGGLNNFCLLYTSPSPRDATLSRMPSSA